MAVTRTSFPLSLLTSSIIDNRFWPYSGRTVRYIFRQFPQPRQFRLSGAYDSPVQFQYRSSYRLLLNPFEIFHGVFKHTYIIIAGNVFVKSETNTPRCGPFFRTLCRRERLFLNGAHRIVGIKVYVRRGVSVKVDILCGNLAVFLKLLYKLGLGNKSALAVGNGHAVNVAHLCRRKPRRHI